MKSDIDSHHKVQSAARGLGFKGPGSALGYLKDHCQQQVRRWAKELDASTLSELCDAVAAKLGLLVKCIESDDELDALVDEYVAKGEGGLACVPSKLDADTFALVIRLKSHFNGHAYVAVIDCRGRKQAKKYFSIWHEIVHLLVEPQLKFEFRQTSSMDKDPFEAAIDAIAGDLAFSEDVASLSLPPGVAPSLAAFSDIHKNEAPEASVQSCYSTIVKRLKQPALLIVAEPALKVAQQREQRSGSLFAGDQPLAVLRATTIIPSPSASTAGLRVHKNIRVPARSVIHRVYSGADDQEHRTCAEDLSWWGASGRQLDALAITVEAAHFGPRVLALVLCNGTPAKMRRQLRR